MNHYLRYLGDVAQKYRGIEQVVLQRVLSHEMLKLIFTSQNSLKEDFHEV